MYPQINLAGGFSNPAPLRTEPALGTSHSFNGPGSPTDPSTTLLRVVIAEKFRVAPPVPVPASAHAALSAASPGTPSDPTAAPAAVNFDYEKAILKELEEAGRKTGVAAQNSIHREDKCEALMSQCVSSGHSREEAALALSVALTTSGQRADGATVAQAAKNLRHLTSMGFSKGDAVGALVVKNGDLQAAVDML